MNHNKIAVRYTKALYDLALEQSLLETVYSDVQLIEQTLRQNPDLKALTENPVVSVRKKSNAFTAVFNGRVNNLTLRFIELVVANKREYYLNRIVTHFSEKYRKEKGIKLVTITSPIELEAHIKEKISGLISQTAGVKKVMIQEYINPDLIGGFVIKVDDLQLDASVKLKLDKIRRGLMKASV